MNKEPHLNQIDFLDLNYRDSWDSLWRSKPYLIIKIIRFVKKGKVFFCLHLLPITSQDEEEIKTDKRLFISQYKIFQLPNCLKINPSFIRIQRYVNLINIEKNELAKFLCDKCPDGCFKWIAEKNQNEYDFLVNKHHSNRNDKLNVFKQLPPIEINWSEK